MSKAPMLTSVKVTDLRIFEVTRPDPKNPEQKKTYYLTKADRPVTYNGVQYIPIDDVSLDHLLGDHLGSL